MRGHNLGRRLAADGHGLRIDARPVSPRSILVFWCRRCIGRWGIQRQYLSALRRLPSCAESGEGGSLLQVVGRDQRYAGRRLSRDGNHLPNLLSPARVPLLTAPRALVEGLASPFPKTKAAPPGLRPRTLVLGRGKGVDDTIVDAVGAATPGPWPLFGAGHRGVGRSVEPASRPSQTSWIHWPLFVILHRVSTRLHD